MINLNEAKLMNEENWIETTKMKKNLKKLMKKFAKQEKHCKRMGNAGENRKGMET